MSWDFLLETHYPEPPYWHASGWIRPRGATNERSGIRRWEVEESPPTLFWAEKNITELYFLAMPVPVLPTPPTPVTPTPVSHWLSMIPILLVLSEPRVIQLPIVTSLWGHHHPYPVPTLASKTSWTIWVGVHFLLNPLWQWNSKLVC